MDISLKCNLGFESNLISPNPFFCVLFIGQWLSQCMPYVGSHACLASRLMIRPKDCRHAGNGMGNVGNRFLLGHVTWVSMPRTRALPCLSISMENFVFRRASSDDAAVRIKPFGFKFSNKEMNAWSTGLCSKSCQLTIDTEGKKSLHNCIWRSDRTFEINETRSEMGGCVVLRWRLGFGKEARRGLQLGWMRMCKEPRDGAWV